MFAPHATIAISVWPLPPKRLYPVRDTALISLSVDLNYLEWSNFHPNLGLAICGVFAQNVTIANRLEAPASLVAAAAATVAAVNVAATVVAAKKKESEDN